VGEIYIAFVEYIVWMLWCMRTPDFNTIYLLSKL